jgi:flagellar protein FliO/FliZ
VLRLPVFPFFGSASAAGRRNSWRSARSGFAIFLALTFASLAWAEGTPPAPAPALEPAPAVAPAPDKPSLDQPSLDKPSPLPTDDANRLAEPEIPKSEPPELAAEEFSVGWTLLRTMIVLAMVVALAYLTLNIGLRKLLGIKAPVGTSVVTVLERVALDQKRSLFVVEAAGEVLLLGGAESALSLITKLDRTEVERLKTVPPASPVQLSPFLKKLLGKPEKSEEATPPPPAAPKLDGNP